MKIFSDRKILPKEITDSRGPDEITIKEHAADRLILLWYDLNVLYNIAPDSPDVVVTITSAKAQGRIATVVGNQAAHANFMAGAKVCNLLEVF